MMEHIVKRKFYSFVEVHGRCYCDGVGQIVQPRQQQSGGGGYANGRARRQEILRTAADHFGAYGFTGLTVRDIAAACGISRAGLLHHFPSKEDLLLAVLEERDDADRLRFEPYVAAEGALGVVAGMIDLADHNRSNPGLIELFAKLAAEASRPDHPAHEYFVRRVIRIREDTARALRAAQKAGEVRGDLDVDMAAVRMTALMDGLQSNWLLDRSTDLPGQVSSAVSELLTEAGRARLQAWMP